MRTLAMGLFMVLCFMLLKLLCARIRDRPRLCMARVGTRAPVERHASDIFLGALCLRSAVTLPDLFNVI